MNSSEISCDQPFTVFIEGNVGSGKSTLLKHFSKFKEFLVLEEPIEKWRNCQGQNLLDLKFSDPDRHQFSFQSYATLTRLKQHLQKADKPIKMLERSLLTAKHCFVQNLYETGALSEGAYHVMNEWYNFVNDYHPIRCDVIVYLRTTPEVVSARIKERAREEESQMEDEYLKQLHERHEKLFADKELFSNVHLITLDADKGLEDMQMELDRCHEEIMRTYTASKERRDFVIRI